MLEIIIIIIIIYSLTVFHISFSWWFFSGVWLTANILKSPRLLSILAVHNNAVVWIVSTRPPTSKFTNPFNSPLVSVPKAPITISISVTFMCHSFFSIPSQGLYTYASFILLSAETAKSTILQILFFFCWVFWPIFCDPFFFLFCLDSFGLVLSPIQHCWLINVKSLLHIYK